MAYISKRFTVEGQHKHNEKAVELADQEFTIKINALAKELGLGAKLLNFAQTAMSNRGHFPKEADSPVTIVTFEYLTIWEVKSRNTLY